MDRSRRRLSELSSKELSRSAVAYRQTPLTAHGEHTIKSLNVLAARYAILPAKHEVEEASADRATTHQDRSEVDQLTALAEQAAASVSEPVGALADAIKMMADNEADPYLTMGVLLEGAVHVLRTSLPPERQVPPPYNSYSTSACKRPVREHDCTVAKRPTSDKRPFAAKRSPARERRNANFRHKAAVIVAALALRGLDEWRLSL